jgi:hypothetical protein
MIITSEQRAHYSRILLWHIIRFARITRGQICPLYPLYPLSTLSLLCMLSNQPPAAPIQITNTSPRTRDICSAQPYLRPVSSHPSQPTRSSVPS